jgi:chromosome partitioning protein
MSRVIAIANQKGGVGKTTTAINLGASLAAAEYRTLVLDLDPQGNCTSGIGVSGETAKNSIYGVLLDMAPIGGAIVRGVHLPYLDVLPASQDLAGAEIELMDQPDPPVRLRRVLDAVRDLYDFILIDCPPAMGILTVNALAAADSVLIPLQPEYFALEGLSHIAGNIELVRKSLNPRLRVEGILLTMMDRRLKLAREVEDEVRRSSGMRIFRTSIPRNVTLAAAPSFGQPVVMYDIRSDGARAYLSLVAEITGLHVLPRAPRREHALAG